MDLKDRGALWLKTLGAEVYGVSKDIPSEPCHFSGKLNNQLTIFD